MDSSTGCVPSPGKVAPAGTIQNSEVMLPALPVLGSMRLASMACFASPPERYALPSTARSAARFLRFSVGSALPTITSLLSAFCCRFLATSSRIALHSLSTRHGFPIFAIFEKSHSLNLLACGGGGGGTSTVTWLDAEAVKPRESVQVALT